MSLEDRLHDPNLFIDLVEVVGRLESFTDFEGMADSSPLFDVINNLQVQQRLRLYKSPDDPKKLRSTGPSSAELEDLLKHYAYENLDQGDYVITVDEALMFIDIVAYILGSRYWMRDKES